MEKARILIDCPTCEARVNAEVEAHQYLFTSDDSIPDFVISFIKCPACQSPLLARQKQVNVIEVNGDLDCEWGNAVRLWPEPPRETHESVPSIVQVSLEEARRCYRAGAYTACAVMCGKALEGICVHFGTRNHLFQGLRELRERQLIDERLLQWGEQLRKHRNIAAHATNEEISQEDSTDLLEFLSAICEYIFVLTARFDAFMKRQEASAVSAISEEPKAKSMESESKPD